MAGIEYEPSVKSTSDTLLAELEERVETLTDTLDYVKVLLRRLAAENALQSVLGQAVESPVATAVETLPRFEESLQTLSKVPAVGLAVRADEALLVEPADAAPLIEHNIDDQPADEDELTIEGAHSFLEALQAPFAVEPVEIEEAEAPLMGAAMEDVLLPHALETPELEPVAELPLAAPDTHDEAVVVPVPDAIEDVVEPVAIEALLDVETYDTEIAHDIEPETESELPEVSDEARDEVRRAVELMRLELQGWRPPSSMIDIPNQAAVQPDGYDEDPSPDIDPRVADAAREEVRRAVAKARADLAASGPHSPLGAMTGPVQGVHFNAPAARTGGPTGTPGATQPSEAPAPAGHMTLPAHAKESHFDERQLTSPSIVIEDPEGRVELVRVYDTLSRVNCSGQAVLLNYTPHSVTVGLGVTEAPDETKLAEAVRYVFGRSCKVASDGVRLAVTLTDGVAA